MRLSDNHGVSIRAVIFDIGDVLEVNPRTRWRQRWAHWLGVDVAEFEGSLERIWSPGAIGALGLGEIEQRTGGRPRRRSQHRHGDDEGRVEGIRWQSEP